MKTLMTVAAGALAMTMGLAMTSPAQAVGAGLPVLQFPEASNKTAVEQVHYRRYRRHHGPRVYFNFGYGPSIYVHRHHRRHYYRYYTPRYRSYYYSHPSYYRYW